MRVQQSAGEKGSLKWIQDLVQHHRTVLDQAVGTAITLAPGEAFEWRSPLHDDEFAEYRDARWLDRIGHPELTEQLKAFWPSRGPQWDALAVTTLGRVVLVEAKAHVKEIVSPPSAAGEKSAPQIAAALDEAKDHYGVPRETSWSSTYYQYANRLAHLFFLRKHGVNAHLVFLYIVGDNSMAMPASREQWRGAIDDTHRALGIGAQADGIHEVFIDVAELDGTAAR